MVKHQTNSKTVEVMFWRKQKKTVIQTSSSDPVTDNPLLQTDHGPTLPHRTQQLLGITVLLSQLPLLFHLPLWLSLPGMGLVSAKVFSKPKKHNLLAPALILVFVLLSAVAIFFHYGHMFGRDPCVAFLFLLIGFKFVEARRTYDASLLIILCAFLLLTQFFFRQSLTSAILIIPAIYSIGLSLFMLQRGTAPTDTRTVIHITAKLFLQAMPVAMLLFVAVPRVAQAPWGNGNGEAQTGLSDRMSPGSIASLSKSNEVAFRVEFDNQIPNRSQRYWRGPVLTGFDGHDWFILPTNKPARLRHEDHGPAINYTVTTPATYQPWLLALDTPAGKPTSSTEGTELVTRIDDERQISTLKPLDTALRYNATSVLSDRYTPANTPGAEALLTTSSNPRTRQLASQLRSESPNDAAFVNKVLQWFNHEPFHYTLNPPRLGKNSIDDFIFNTRRGFCEHYAGSFVFMMRAAGIPSRVVTGYQGGEMNDGYMIVRQSDAHAWAEVFIDGQWRRYDPTGAVAPQRVEQGANEALQNDPSRSSFANLQIPLLNNIALKWDAINFAWQRLVINFDTSSQKALWKKLGIEKPSGWMIVLAITAAALAWALMIIKPFPSRHPSLKPCESYWQLLVKKLESQGLTKDKGETPTRYIQRACERWPQHHTALSALVDSYHRGMFTPQGTQLHHHQQMALEMKFALKEIGKLE